MTAILGTAALPVVHGNIMLSNVIRLSWTDTWLLRLSARSRGWCVGMAGPPSERYNDVTTLVRSGHLSRPQAKAFGTFRQPRLSPFCPNTDVSLDNRGKLLCCVLYHCLYLMAHFG